MVDFGQQRISFIRKNVPKWLFCLSVIRGYLIAKTGAQIHHENAAQSFSCALYGEEFDF